MNDISNIRFENRDFTHDVVILGSGSSGVRLARRLAQAKQKVALVGKHHIGGTCVNLGCVPKKIFAHIARLSNYQNRQKKINWTNGSSIISWSDVLRFKQEYINNLRQLYSINLEKAGVDLYNSPGEFLDPYTVQVDDKRLVGRHIVVSTGTKPNKLNIPGAEFLSTSDDFFNLPTLPKQCLIIGMGYIALETASFLQAMGSEVIVVQHNNRCLSTFDQDVVNELRKVLQERGIRFIWNVNLTKIEMRDHNLLCTLDNKSQLMVDRVFVAIGRIPNTNKISLDRANLKVNNNGFIVVDECYRTSQQHILALGDVIGGLQLTPIAIKHAELATEYLLTGRIKSTLSKFIPTAVFTDPEIAGVGLSDTLTSLNSRDNLSIFKKRFVSIQEGLFVNPFPTFMKIVCDKKSQTILGVHIMHNDAAEIIQAFSPLLDAGITLSQLDYSVRLHPTVAEDLLSW